MVKSSECLKKYGDLEKQKNMVVWTHLPDTSMVVLGVIATYIVI